MGVERHGTVAAKMPCPHPRGRLAAPGKTEVFQQHRQRDGEAVIDRGVAHVRYRYAGRGLGLGDRNLRAELAQSGRGRDVLMGMRLRAAAHANAGRTCSLAADHERRTAVGHRAAIQQLQRHRHRL